MSKRPRWHWRPWTEIRQSVSYPRVTKSTRTRSRRGRCNSSSIEGIFIRGRKPDHGPNVKDLNANIRQLSMENDLLSVVLGCISGLRTKRSSTKGWPFRWPGNTIFWNAEVDKKTTQDGKEPLIDSANFKYHHFWESTAFVSTYSCGYQRTNTDFQNRPNLFS